MVDSFTSTESISAKQALAKTPERLLELEEAVEAACQCYVYYTDPLEKAERARPSSNGSRTGVRHQVNQRDKARCQFIYSDGSQCEEEKWIHQHHIIHQKDGGPDTVENLITMCARHHRIIHKHH